MFKKPERSWLESRNLYIFPILRCEIFRNHATSQEYFQIKLFFLHFELVLSKIRQGKPKNAGKKLV